VRLDGWTAGRLDARQGRSPTGHGSVTTSVTGRLPLSEVILRWWHDVGGQAVTFGSDAHRPGRLAEGFAQARAMVEAVGFRPATDVVDPWRRA
jgi:histidinol-phosphatase (PHP family)